MTGNNRQQPLCTKKTWMVFVVGAGLLAGGAVMVSNKVEHTYPLPFIMIAVGSLAIIGLYLHLKKKKALLRNAAAPAPKAAAKPKAKQPAKGAKNQAAASKPKETKITVKPQENSKPTPESTEQVTQDGATNSYVPFRPPNQSFTELPSGVPSISHNVQPSAPEMFIPTYGMHQTHTVSIGGATALPALPTYGLHQTHMASVGDTTSPAVLPPLRGIYAQPNGNSSQAFGPVYPSHLPPWYTQSAPTHAPPSYDNAVFSPTVSIDHNTENQYS